MLILIVELVTIQQTDWTGGAVAPGCSYNDLSCLNSNCDILDGNFNDSFCTRTDSLVFHAEGKLTIYGLFQYLVEHTVKGPTKAGGWDNDPDIFDVDQDGHMDLVVTDESFPDNSIPNDSVWVFLNDGNGNFTQINVDWELESVDEIHENDADGDGDIDLFTVGHSQYDEDVVLFVNTGSGWTKCVICKNLNGSCNNSTPGSGEAEGIYTGDLDGDGDIDIAVTHLGDGAIYVFEKVPPGTPNSYGCTISSHDYYYVKHLIEDRDNNYGWNVIIEDVDADSDNDIVVTFSRDLMLYKNNGSLSFTPILIASTTPDLSRGFYGLDVDDIDGDGDPDIVVSDRRNTSSSDGNVNIYLNDGSGNFTLHTSISIPHPMGVVINDVEADGDKDIFVASYYDDYSTQDSTIYILINDGNSPPNFTPENQSPYITRRSYFGVGSGDLDGDGDADLLVRAGRKPGGNPSVREGLYWYSSVLYYFDSAKVVSNIVDINGSSSNENWRFDSIIVRGKYLEYASVYIRYGRNIGEFQTTGWIDINDIGTCNTYGSPVDSIKCHISDLDGPAQDTFAEFIQYRIDLYAHDGDLDSYKEINATIHDIQFKFNENITPISIKEKGEFIEISGEGYAHIYDVRGRLLKSIRTNGLVRIRRFLKPGIYVIIFKGDSGRVLRRKIIVR